MDDAQVIIVPDSTPDRLSEDGEAVFRDADRGHKVVLVTKSTYENSDEDDHPFLFDIGGGDAP